MVPILALQIFLLSCCLYSPTKSNFQKNDQFLDFSHKSSYLIKLSSLICIKYLNWSRYTIAITNRQ